MVSRSDISRKVYACTESLKPALSMAALSIFGFMATPEALGSPTSSLAFFESFDLAVGESFDLAAAELSDSLLDLQASEQAARSQTAATRRGAVDMVLLR